MNLKEMFACEWCNSHSKVNPIVVHCCILHNVALKTSVQDGEVHYANVLQH